MSWADRRHRFPDAFAGLALIVGAALGGCGFHPLYGGVESGAVSEELAAIRVAPIPERMGQILANSLRDGLNPRGVALATRYILNVNLTTTRGDFSIRQDGTASRELFVAYASFTLYPVGAGSAPTFSGSVRANNSYDLGESPYAVIVANSDAETRAAQEISAEIRSRLAVFLRRQATKS